LGKQKFYIFYIGLLIFSITYIGIYTLVLILDLLDKKYTPFGTILGIFFLLSWPIIAIINLYSLQYSNDVYSNDVYAFAIFILFLTFVFKISVVIVGLASNGTITSFNYDKLAQPPDLALGILTIPTIIYYYYFGELLPIYITLNYLYYTQIKYFDPENKNQEYYRI